MTELSAWSVAILVNAEDENSRRWEFGADAAHDFDAVQARHRHGQDGDVGARLARQSNGINPVGTFRNDVAAAAAQQQADDPLPHEGVVVSDQHPDETRRTRRPGIGDERIANRGHGRIRCPNWPRRKCLTAARGYGPLAASSLP